MEPDKNDSLTINPIITVAVSLMVIAAVFDPPYGYFTFLRIIVTAYASVCVFATRNAENPLPFLYGGIAVLFNPIIPIYIEKDIWNLIDIGVGIFFVWGITWTRRRQHDG